MFSVYILESIKTKKCYIGQTNDLAKRLKIHNQGKNFSTKVDRLWQLIYKKYFLIRGEAIKFEKYLKSFKSRKYLLKIINNNNIDAG